MKRQHSKWAPILAILLFLAPLGTVAATQSPAAASITTTVIAGTGTAGPYATNVKATTAVLNGPQGVAVDSSGEVFIADEYNDIIRKVDTSGNIQLVYGVAQTPQLISSGGLYHPSGVAVAANGTVYVADTLNNVVWANGSLFAGNPSGAGGYSGDGGPALDSGTKLDNPTALAYDDSTSTLYIVDTYNCVVRSVSSGVIHTIAGNGTCGYSTGNGVATSSELNYPTGVAVIDGKVYIADTSNCRIREVNTASNTISTIAGTGSCSDFGDGGPATSAGTNAPTGIVVDAVGNVFFGGVNGAIREIDTTGNISTVTNVGSSIEGMARDNSNDLFVSMVNSEVDEVSGFAPSTPENLVALGDSVAAGEGINYDFTWNGSGWVEGNSNPTWANTQVAMGKNYPQCHQSGQGYPNLVDAYGYSYNVFNMACTGASVLRNSGLEDGGVLDPELFDKAGQPYPENGSSSDPALTVPQQLGGTCAGCSSLSAQFNSHNPAVVLLTAGANDINFPHWLRTCYTDTASCNSSAHTTTLRSELYIEKADLRLSLAELNRWAGTKSSPLRVYVTNYYDPYSTSNTSCIDVNNGGHFPGISVSGPNNGLSWLMSGLSSLNSNISAEVTYAQHNDPNLSVHLVDLSGVMSGHQFCTADPWVYGISIDYPSWEHPLGSANPAPSHPTPQGQNAIARAVSKALSD